MMIIPKIVCFENPKNFQHEKLKKIPKFVIREFAKITNSESYNEF